MKRFALALAAVLSSLVVAFPAQAAPAETIHFSFNGQSADAFFTSTDPSGCIQTDVFVSAVDGKIKQDGAPEVESLASVAISRFDLCTGTVLLSAFGSATLAPTEFVIDRQLVSASLDTTVTVMDFVSGASFPVDVAVNWTGTGATFRVKQHFQIITPGFKLNSRFDGTFREAAASGTISDGTSNFTPEPAAFADMSSVKSGEVSIVH
jgi:hypothetical protein